MTETYRCRFLAPRETSWEDVSASSPEDAAQKHHDRHRDISVKFCPDPDKGGSRIHFARIEVEGHGDMVSRLYTSGIIRKGGVKNPFLRPLITIEGVVKAIGWQKPPAELLEPGWDGEETEWS